MIDPDDLERARREAKRSGLSIGSALVRLGVIKASELTEFLATQYGCPALHLSTQRISAEATKLVPRETALRLLTIPVERVGSVLIVAMADPSNVSAMEELEGLTGFDLEVTVSAEPEIREAIEKAYPT